MFLKFKRTIFCVFLSLFYACSNQPKPNLNPPAPIPEIFNQEAKLNIDTLLKILPERYKDNFTYIERDGNTYTSSPETASRLAKIKPVEENVFELENSGKIVFPPLTAKPDVSEINKTDRVVLTDINKCTDGGKSGAFDRVFTRPGTTLTSTAKVPASGTFPSGQVGINWMHAKVHLPGRFKSPGQLKDNINLKKVDWSDNLVTPYIYVGGWGYGATGVGKPVDAGFLYNAVNGDWSLFVRAGSGTGIVGPPGAVQNVPPVGDNSWVLLSRFQPEQDVSFEFFHTDNAVIITAFGTTSNVNGVALAVQLPAGSNWSEIGWCREMISSPHFWNHET
jgi:hypothetical protein